MKKVLYAILTSLLLSSCLGSPMLEATDAVEMTFDYDNSLFVDSLYFDTQYRTGYGYENLVFHQKIDGAPNLTFKGGFMVSMLQTPKTGNTETLKNNKYRSNVKVDAAFKNKYAVFCQTDNMPEKHLQFITLSNGLVSTCTATAVFVTNTVEVEDAIKNTFEDGNRLILTATSYLGGVKVNSTSINLAEYTTDKDTILSEWTLFDLRSLGNFDQIRFDIQAPMGKDIPKAVCMDHFLASISMKTK